VCEGCQQRIASICIGVGNNGLTKLGLSMFNIPRSPKPQPAMSWASNTCVEQLEAWRRPSWELVSIKRSLKLDVDVYCPVEWKDIRELSGFGEVSPWTCHPGRGRGSVRGIARGTLGVIYPPITITRKGPRAPTGTVDCALQLHGIQLPLPLHPFRSAIPFHEGRGSSLHLLSSSGGPMRRWVVRLPPQVGARPPPTPPSVHCPHPPLTTPSRSLMCSLLDPRVHWPHPPF